MGEVRLVDLEIIKRFSLAIRQEAAPAEDLLAALDASRELVLAALDDGGATPAKSTKRAAKTAKAARPAKPRPSGQDAIS